MPKLIQCWLITKYEPTSDQRAVVQRYHKRENVNIRLLSFSHFQSKLIDVKSYLSLRDKYKFGSVHDPSEVDKSLNPKIEYIQLDVIDEDKHLWNVPQVCEKIENNGRIVLLGDYGAGKSMTLREVYRALRIKNLTGKSFKFPIYINLRDHLGQKDPDEILHRHAKLISFEPSNHLVRAWRAGYAYIILDGFDEITSLGIQNKWRRLKDMRFRSMEAIRKFVNQTTQDTGLIIAGRAFFFDSEKERKVSLCDNQPFINLSLNDFTEKQIEEFLQKNNITGVIPVWMPSRPLLVGTLLLKGVLQSSIASPTSDHSFIDHPGSGWDTLLNEIAKREAKIEAGIDSDTIRQLFDRFATKARESDDGLGSFTQEDIMSVFFDICQYQPDEQAIMILQRLPGLGVASAVEGTRKFIDEDFADACRAGDFVRFINDPFNFDADNFLQTFVSLGETGMAVSLYKFDQLKITEKKYNAAISLLTKRENLDYLKSDCVCAGNEFEYSIKYPVSIYNVFLNQFNLERNTDLSKVKYYDSYIINLVIPEEADSDRLPFFYSCYFYETEGRTSLKEMPQINFDENCIFESFVSAAQTTDEFLDLKNIPSSVRVLLTVLKKIYWQKGSGRLESALFRGLDGSNKRYVPDILRILESQKLTICYSRRGVKIWLPIRTQLARVSKIISSPTVTEDPIIREVKKL